MTLYVGLINLDRSAARLASVSHHLAEAGLIADRISAVDGEQLTCGQLAKYDRRGAGRLYRRLLGRGEIGCYLSHIEALTRFLATDATQALILEDDAAFDPEFGALVGRLAEVLAVRGDWDVVNLGNGIRRSHSRSVWIGDDGSGYQLCHAHHFPSLTTALFWSRSGAAAFLDYALPLVAPLDLRLKEWCIRTDRGLAFTVAPVKSIGTESCIDGLALRPGCRGERLSGYFIVKQKRHAVNRLLSLRNRLRHVLRKGGQALGIEDWRKEALQIETGKIVQRGQKGWP